MSEAVPAEAEELLSSEPLAAFLATSVEDRPHVAPVWYRYEDGVVEVVTTGRKLANLRENPRAALAVQKATAGIPEWTATVLGTATVVEDGEPSRAAIRRINEKYGVEPDAWAENVLVRIDAGSASYRTY
jgi:nitroimidazol reductase NimA-like FMN-containing flavoprotein (pyridoxamine 5'-phosphate oxidase superfamily)